jgi:hypothetical protein
MLKAAVLWVVGLVTAVPYATYYLLFEAPRDQYAILLFGILFWVFGYWGAVGPLLMIAKARSVFRAIEAAQSSGDLMNALANPDARDLAIDLIASDNHIPKFVAARVYELLRRSLASRAHDARSRE